MAYNAIGVLQNKHNVWCNACGNTKLEIKNTPDKHRQYGNHIFLVYMHVNKINGKVYIGITHHVNPNRRWGYSGQKYTHCVKFLNAINKYGWENFEHVILCRTTKEKAIVIERTLIAHYKKLGISYNLADGGEGTEAITDETRQKLSEKMKANHPMKGKHHTPEARAKISEAGRNRVMKASTRQKLEEKVWSKRRNVPIKRSKESILKQAKALSMPVIQLDLNGNVIREFPSTRVADEYINNGKRCNHIADACNGKRQTASGYKWKYKEEKEVICTQ